MKLLLIIAVFLISISNYNYNSVNSKPVKKTLVTNSISTWAYQLQNVDMQELKNSTFDLFVIDYSQDGSNATAWTPSTLNLLKNGGKIVVSYISIGEAEDYRYYWQNDWLTTNKPSWLGSENPDWPGNYKIKFWEKGWQDIIYNYLDIIIKQGFNGVYLDIIDAYQYYQDLGVSNADVLMMDFVHNISLYTRSKTNNNFLIIPQNGEDLLSNSTYRSSISGIGIEDLYYNSNGLKQKTTETSQRENLLSLLVNENKFVLTVDYVHDPSKELDVYTRARANGFVPYTTDLALDKLTPPFNTSIAYTKGGNKSTYSFEYTSIFVIVIITIFKIHSKKKKKIF